MTRSAGRLCCAFAILALLAGCGGSDDRWVAGRKPVVPVSGRITFKGAPLEGAIIILHAPEGDLAAQGRTDDDGHFQLTTYEDYDGAVVGTHTVTVRKTEYTKTPTRFHTEEEPSYAMLPTELLPKELATADTSELKATVPDAGTADLNFDF